MPDVLGTLKPPRLAGAPASPALGQIYYDTGTNVLYWWNGTAWISAAGGAGSDTLRYDGDYAAGSYTDGDIVVQNGIAYLCVRPTTAAPAAWPQMGTPPTPGIPAGGATGQVLTKTSSADYAAGWAAGGGGGGGGPIVTALPGSPTDGQTVTLRVGSSAPYTYITVTYDATAAAWYSPTQLFKLIVEQSASNTNVSTPTIAGTYHFMTTWREFALLGLKPQVRFSCDINQQFTQGNAQLAYWDVTLGGSTTGPWAVSGTQIFASSSNGNVTAYRRSPWVLITDTTYADMMLWGLQIWVASNSYSVTCYYPSVELRYASA